MRVYSTNHQEALKQGASKEVLAAKPEPVRRENIMLRRGHANFEKQITQSYLSVPLSFTFSSRLRIIFCSSTILVSLMVAPVSPNLDCSTEL